MSTDPTDWMIDWWILIALLKGYFMPGGKGISIMIH